MKLEDVIVKEENEEIYIYFQFEENGEYYYYKIKAEYVPAVEFWNLKD